MIHYITCPSCSRPIGKNLEKYQSELKEMLADPTKTKAERDQIIPYLLNKYNVRNMCCRNIMMGQIPYEDIIVS